MQVREWEILVNHHELNCVGWQTLEMQLWERG